MRSSWLWFLVGVVFVGGCSFGEMTATTTSVAPVPDSTTTSAAVTTVAPPPTTTTTTAPAVTTTSLARIPEALPIVDQPWEWTKLVASEWASNPRYDGTYLAYGDHTTGVVIVHKNGETVLQHEPPDGEDWLVQDIELGERWLAIVSVTSELAAQPTRSSVVVYNLETYEVAFEESWDGGEAPVRLPEVSLSGAYMAFIDPSLETTCLDVYRLPGMNVFETICADAPIGNVEMDGLAVTFDTSDGGCRSVWTASLYRRNHNLVEHGNRDCWSQSPVGGATAVVWFERPPDGSTGNPLMIGEGTAGEMVSLGRGAPGRAETCWNQTYWNGGNGDIRTWDGGDTIGTIRTTDAISGWGVGCVGPWVTFSNAEGVFTANMFTQSSADACTLVEVADTEDNAGLAAALKEWVHATNEEPPADLQVSVRDAIELDGWWVGHGGFSSHLEGALFAWGPDGDIHVAWSGNADSEYEVRGYMLTTNPEVPAPLLGCIDVTGYASPPVG